MHKGATVVYHDPYVESVRLEEDEIMHSSPYSDALLADADAVVIVTDHSSFDYDRIVNTAKLVVDTRNAVNGRGGGARIVSI
jgi:UDP-N-acetyl-D-glucosamine dehydrogenase